MSSQINKEKTQTNKQKVQTVLFLFLMQEGKWNKNTFSYLCKEKLEV